MTTPPLELQLPATAPDIFAFGDIGGTDCHPFALYSLVDASESALIDLARVLERDILVDGEANNFHLVRVAPPSIIRQDSLADVLVRHLKYSKERTQQLEYYPFAFVVAHDMEWEANGVYLVFVDYQKPFSVTSFRIKISDAPEICWVVREDDEGIEMLRDRFEIKDGQQP